MENHQHNKPKEKKLADHTDQHDLIPGLPSDISQPIGEFLTDESKHIRSVSKKWNHFFKCYGVNFSAKPEKKKDRLFAEIKTGYPNDQGYFDNIDATQDGSLRSLILSDGKVVTTSVTKGVFLFDSNEKKLWKLPGPLSRISKLFQISKNEVYIASGFAHENNFILDLSTKRIKRISLRKNREDDIKNEDSAEKLLFKDKQIISWLAFNKSFLISVRYHEIEFAHYLTNKEFNKFQNIDLPNVRELFQLTKDKVIYQKNHGSSFSLYDLSSKIVIPTPLISGLNCFKKYNIFHSVLLKKNYLLCILQTKYCLRNIGFVLLDFLNDKVIYEKIFDKITFVFQACSNEQGVLAVQITANQNNKNYLLLADLSNNILQDSALEKPFVELKFLNPQTLVGIDSETNVHTFRFPYRYTFEEDSKNVTAQTPTNSQHPKK